MSASMNRKSVPLILLVACFILGGLSIRPPSSAAAEKILALGKYDFLHYYAYDELTGFLKDVNKAYPQLTQLSSMCKSPMGRDVWMLTINNPKTGLPEDKPGFFLNQIHAGEVIASMSCNYTIWHLLSNYGKDPQVTRIVDGMVWYIVPRLDVDGAEAYLTGKPAGRDPNPVDNDGDGRFDEDPAEDIDGDGYVVQMRVKDPKGEMRPSKDDARMMVRRAPDEQEGVYRVYSEGIDNDGDGKYNEDGFRTGFSSNRNYPGNWRPQAVQSGGGAFPMEEVVTRAEVDFVAAHPNIAIYLQHHCCGRVILRAPTTGPDRDFKNTGDLELYRIAAARGLEHTGWDLATSVFDWNYPPESGNRKSSQVYRDKDGKLKNLPPGLNPEPGPSGGGFLPCTGGVNDPCENDYLGDHGYYAYGSSMDTMYDLFGIFSMGDEHWATPDYDKDGTLSEKELFRWNDEEMKGKLFVNWHAFTHSSLGEVEIGGWIRTKASPPEGELIQRECEMGNRFVTYLAGLAPRVVIGEPKVVDKKGGIYEITFAVENKGILPTAVEQAQGLDFIKPVTVEVATDDNTEILSGEKREKLGQIKGNSESRKLVYLVRTRDASRKAALKVSVTSQKAGKDSREIAIP